MTEMIRPIHADNAIESFSVSVTFASPMADDAFVATIDMIRQTIARELQLPGEEALHELSLRFSIFGEASHGKSSGIAFQRFSPAGAVVAELKVDRAIVVLTLRDNYPGWKVFDATIAPHMCRLLHRYYAECEGVQAISMQFQNRFVADGADSKAVIDWRGPVLAKSDFVSDSFSDKSRYWHSHVGLFEGETFGARRLVNVNVDAVDFQTSATSSALSLGLLVLASDQFVVPGFEQRALQEEEIEPFFGQVLDSLHDRLKSILRDVLSADCRSLLNFDGNNYAS